MTLYVDSSALMKRCIDETGSDRFNELLASDHSWLTCRLTADQRQARAARTLGWTVLDG